MTALPFMIVALCVLALAYRYYSAFLITKVFVADASRQTPAHQYYDGQNYYPTTKWVLFGHHFAAIAGAGPLIGPVIAAQFGFFPGFIWILIGCVLAGGVHDLVILHSSVRRKGMSIAEIAKQEISPFAGLVTSVAILFIIVIALAGLGTVVVNALSESSWGTFTIAGTIPIALFIGWYMYVFRKGRIAEASIMGVVAVILVVVAGRWIPQSQFAGWFTYSRQGITLWLAAYGFIASVLPVWLLLAPRDYLSSYMKIGTIAFLVFGVIIVNPQIHMPAFTQFVHGGGPIMKGPLFPFLFITIACGAVSGFHALVSSGTTPKMLNSEADLRPIGYGAMLVEGLVGITSLIAACALYPGDYFAINSPAQVFSTLGMTTQNLPELANRIGETLQGRAGGAVSLAVGMAQIFSGIPGMSGLMSYWYHFAIMFEALFILTTIDAGTRIGRFLLQEFLGKIHPAFGKHDWVWGSTITTAVIVFGWSYFIWTGNISTVWPMFGIANQLLACAALAVGSTVLINGGKARYAWVTVIPMIFISITTLTAGFESIDSIFRPLSRTPGKELIGTLNECLTWFMMACIVLIILDAVRQWIKVWRTGVVSVQHT